MYEKILMKERGVMDFYTRTIESCNPDELFQREIIEICRKQLEQMPELTNKYSSLINWREKLQGNCRHAMHQLQESRPGITAGGDEITLVFERLPALTGSDIIN